MKTPNRHKIKRRSTGPVASERLESRTLLAQVAYWYLDETSGATAKDISGSNTSNAGYTMTLTGSPTWQSPAQVGGGLVLNGSTQYGDAGTTPGSTAVLSVAFWFKASSLKNQIPIDKHPNDATGIGWTVKMRTNGDIYFRIGSNTNFVDAIATSAYVANTWTHFAATFSGGVANVYINGSLRTTLSGITQTVANTTTSLRLAKPSVSSTTEIFGGVLDEVKIWDQVISATSIARQYSVDQLAEATTANKLKKAALAWAVEDALADEAFGNSAGATSTYADIATLLPQAIGTAQSAPSNLFPNIPTFATNPIATDATTRLTDLRNINARYDKNPATYVVAQNSNSTTSEYGGVCYDGLQGTWGIAHPQSTYFGDPRLLTSTLRRFERVYGALTANVAVADFGQTTELAEMYLLFKTVYPDLILPSKKTAWEAAIKKDADKIMTDHATTYNTGTPGALWVNADVRWFAALGVASLIFPSQTSYLTTASNGIQLLENSMYPDGGTPYIDYQNEDMTYHGSTINVMARYWQMFGNQNALDIVTKSYWYYPLSIEAPKVASYSVAPAWKHYWNQVTGVDTAYIVGSLANSPENMRVVQNVTGGSFAGLGSLELATYYNPSITPTPYRDNYITYDRNDLGPRGRFGTWSFSGSANPIAEPLANSVRGKSSFVGAMSLDSSSGTSWTLNAALDSVQSRVRYANLAESGSIDLRNLYYDLTTNVHSTFTITDDFASISGVYNAGKYDETVLRNWVGQQEWIYTPQRLVGLVSMRSTATQTAYALEGVIKLVSGRATWGTAKTLSVTTDPDGALHYTYGNMNVRVIGHNYAGIYTDYIDTWDAGTDTPTKKMGRLRFIDQNSLANGGFDPNDTLNTQLDLVQSTYTSAMNRYYMVEIYPSTTTAATSVAASGDPLSTSLRGIELVENGKRYRIIDNPTSGALTYSTNLTWTNGAVVHYSGEQYRPSWLDTYSVADTDFRGRSYSNTLPTGIASGNISISIPAYSHIVLETNNAPTVATPAAATPNPVAATTTALSVLGADDGGEANLTYLWSVLSKPVGASDPTFSINGTNAAKNSVATFSALGSYTFRCTITDAGGLSVTSDVNVTVQVQNPILTGTTAADIFYLKRSGTTFQLFNTDPASGSPINSWPTWSLNSLTFNAGNGNDVLILDHTGGNPVPAGGVVFNGEVGTDTVDVRGAVSSDAFTVTGSSITRSALSTTFATTETLKLTKGLFTLTANLAGLNLHVVSSNAKALFNTAQTIAALTLGSGASAQIAPGGNNTLVVTSLSMTAAQLDLTNNAFVLKSPGQLASAVSLIQAGQNGFDNNGLTAWNGLGIISSSAQSNNLSLGVDTYAVGAIRNGDLNDLFGTGSAYSLFKGVAVGNEDILVRYTYQGDANLDGDVNIDDYNAIDAAFLNLIPIRGWASGDFDFNNSLSIDDYNAIDTGFLYSLGSLGV